MKRFVLVLGLLLGGMAPPDRLQDEAVGKLQALLAVDTANPPGNEAAAAELVAGWLRAEGIEPTLIETAPGRKAVIARLKGSGARQPLLLLNHLDVVPAEPEHWKYPPFAGRIAEGALWGRGALDMKGLGVMELVAFLELKRRRIPLGRDVIFCATPDEEAGGAQGVGWLLSHVPEQVRASEVLNEGGMGLVAPGGRTIMGIQTAERGALWLRVTARGKPGHGSLDRPDSATRRLIRGLARLDTASRKWEVVPEVVPMLAALAPSYPGIDGFVLFNLGFPGLVGLVGPLIAAREPDGASLVSWSINTTTLRSGTKVNVIPSEASAEIDVRMLPGHTAAEAEAHVRRSLHDPGLEVEVLHAKDPSRSPPDGPLFAALARAAREEYPGIAVTQALTPGGTTDSGAFRALGARCYGVIPIVATRDQLTGMHGHNERITLEQVGAGTRVVCRAVALAAGGQ